MADQPQVFKYERPDVDPTLSKIGTIKDWRRSSTAKGKASFRLCRSDLVRADVKVLVEGGEDELHYHPGNDGFWMVLEGRARYYGEGDVVISELGKHEGILIPRGFSYWFESVGDEPLELLHVAALVQNIKDVTIKPGKVAP